MCLKECLMTFTWENKQIWGGSRIQNVYNCGIHVFKSWKKIHQHISYDYLWDHKLLDTFFWSYWFNFFSNVLQILPLSYLFLIFFLTFKSTLKQSSQYLLFSGQKHLRMWREAPIIFIIQTTHLFPPVAATLPFTPLYSLIWLPSFLAHIPQGFTEVLPQSQLSILTPPPHSQSTSFFHTQLRTPLLQKSPWT